jgi:hypothetical protein
MGVLNFGGSGSKTKTQANSQSSTFVDETQQPFLQDLYRQANALNLQQQTQVGQRGAELGAQLQNQGHQVSQGLQQTAAGNSANQQGLAALGSQSNPYLQQQVNGLGGDIGRFLQTSLGNIGSGFANSGQYGSSRQGLAEGQAITGAINEFGQQAANLRGGDLTRQADALGMAGQLQNQAGATVQSGLNDRFDLGMGQFNAQWNPLLNAQEIIGDPNNLSQSTSRQTGQTTSGKVGLGFDGF